MRILLSLTIATILSVVLMSNADADFSLKLGGSLNEPSLLTHKMITVSHTGHLLSVFDYQLEAGAFNTGTNLTYFTGPSIGLSIAHPSYYFKVFTGPVIISPTDEHLGTNLEINSDLELGLKDERGVGIGFGYKHLSNAGTGGPNLGRDFLYFKVMVP